MRATTRELHESYYKRATKELHEIYKRARRLFEVCLKTPLRSEPK